MSLNSQFAAQLLQECPWPVNISYGLACDHGISHVSVEYQTYWIWAFPKAISQVLSVHDWARHGDQEKPQIVIKIDRGGYCNLSNASLSSWVPESDNQIPFWRKQCPNAELCHGEACNFLSSMYIHRQTYPHTFGKHHTHIHKNIHEEDLGLQSLSVQVHGSNGDLKQTEIWYQVVNTSLILQMTHADKFAHTSPQNSCWENVNSLLAA